MTASLENLLETFSDEQLRAELDRRNRLSKCVKVQDVAQAAEELENRLAVVQDVWQLTTAPSHCETYFEFVAELRQSCVKALHELDPS